MRATTRARSFATYTTEQALKILDNHFAPAVKRAPTGNNIVCKEAKGCWITDVSGKKYMDFQTGIGVANTGHSHPKVLFASLAFTVSKLLLTLYGKLLLAGSRCDRGTSQEWHSFATKLYDFPASSGIDRGNEQEYAGWYQQVLL